MKKLSIILLLIMYVAFNGCKITKITQPVSADKNTTLTVTISVTDNLVPENNPNKGLIGVLIPQDWKVEGGSYSSPSLGSGSLYISDDWADSIEAAHPSMAFPGNMKWVALVSDKGYTYTSAVDIDIELKLVTGQTEGCFSLGYLVTKASPGLISGAPDWAPFSYPNKIAVPFGSSCEELFKAERAEDWNSLFARTSGWTGSDGIYSIPMNMSEKPGGQNHLILFSDTFIGKVDSNKKRYDTKMVNNTLAYLKGNRPAEDSISFMWNNQESAAPASMFVPNTPNAKAGEYYWLMDGIKIKDTVHVFALRVFTTESGAAMGFDLAGSAVLSFNLSAENRPVNVRQTECPFFTKNGSSHSVMGQAILPNTRESGNINPDGYIYIYGPKSGSTKELLAGRTKPEDILNFPKWEFWNGSQWTGDFMAAAPITNNLSQEFSVSEVNGKYMVVFQTGSSVAVRMGDSPVGPFGFFSEVYRCPETDISDNVFVYNAKAHPSLSDNGSVLVSYNVNTFDFLENINNADVYRPRFIRLTVKDNQSGVIKDADNPAAYKLLQNYPNPFNNATKIEFELDKPALVSIKVYNSLGQLVSTLMDLRQLSAGKYQTSWEPVNLPSGIYFYSLETETFKERRKMVLLK